MVDIVLDCEKLLVRVGAAVEYLAALEEFMNAEWNSVYVRLINGQLSIPQKLAAINPMLYDGIIQQHEICGLRTYSSSVMSAGQSCMSWKMWGYKCPFHSPVLEADHLFPYSLGGPTDPRNLVLLCKYHNRVKAADIHLYPWEGGCSPWVVEMAERIKSFRDSRLLFDSLRQE